MLLAVGLIPSIASKQVDRVAIIAAGDRTRPAGVFPFRLGGQAIARALAARRQGSSSPRRKPLPRWGGSTTGPWASPPARSASCSRRRQCTSRDAIHRTARDRGCICSDSSGQARYSGIGRFTNRWYCSTVTSLAAMAKRRGMRIRLGRLVPGNALRLGRRRAHAELDRSLDHGEGLPLAVHDTSGGRPSP